MAESMKDFERELEASFKRIDEGDIISGTVVSVDESGVVLDLKFYAEGFIPVEEFSRVPGFNIKEAVQPGDEVQAMVLRRDDGQGNILLSRADAADVLAWDRLKELQDSGEVLDVVVKGIVNGGAIAYVEGVRGFIPASRLALEFVEDTEVFLNKPIQVRVIEVDKAKKRLVLSAHVLRCWGFLSPDNIYSLPEIPSGNIWTGHEVTPAYITRYENSISSPEAYAS